MPVRGGLRREDVGLGRGLRRKRLHLGCVPGRSVPPLPPDGARRGATDPAAGSGIRPVCRAVFGPGTLPLHPGTAGPRPGAGPPVAWTSRPAIAAHVEARVHARRTSPRPVAGRGVLGDPFPVWAWPRLTQVTVRFPAVSAGGGVAGKVAK